jgi:hypothetical protein
MTLRIRAMELRVTTPGGLYGTRQQFKDGLVVFYAGNTMGKSTCMQSILYALGLEGMLSASHAIPLPHAMTHAVEDDDGVAHAVLESSVLLEIENGQGDFLTVQRVAKSASMDTRLIRTWLGPKLTKPDGAFPQIDRFVRMEGAAQRADGFHYALSRFLGWSLPEVTRHQGPPCPLYLECIFPLLLIEQKRGWSGIQSGMPTQYGIKEPGKRAIEFLLNLQQHRVEMQRHRLEQGVAQIKAEWSVVVADFVHLARRGGGIARDLPRGPTNDWPPALRPQILFSSETGVIALDQLIHIGRSELKQLEEMEIPRVESISAELAEGLASTEQEVLRLEMIVERQGGDLEADRAQVSSLEVRLQALEEDRRHNRDIVRLRDLGSTIGLATAQNNCPTCGQPVSDTLIAHDAETMTVEENIKLLEGQTATFEAMRADTERVVVVREAHLRATRARLNEMRGIVRSQRRSLTSDGRAPSEAAIRARLVLEQRIRHLESLREDAALLLTRFDELAVRWADIQALLRQGTLTGLAEDDERKLGLLEESFVAQLREYDFRSIPPRELHISRLTYRPVHDGFDLGFDLSASDMIRSIWAYLVGLLELARQVPTQHAGLLILDEPKQQSTSRMSFATFLRRASQAGAAKQQIIFATSEEPTSLAEALAEIPHTLISIEGRILKKMSHAQ